MPILPAETTRFAPSPTGPLHLGHVHAALFARHWSGRGGRFLLRIEDIDPDRCRPEHEAGLLDDLAWLGFAWEQPVRRQSEHLGAYRLALSGLRARSLVYPCFCSRAAIARELANAGHAPHGPEGPVYPGTCRGLDPALAASRVEAGEPHALRLDLARALAVAGRPSVQLDDEPPKDVEPEGFGDLVLGRRDVPGSYHLAVVHDDALQGVSLVTRGEDLRPAADLHRLLQVLLGLPETRFRHHPLLTDAAGRRLSKRDGAASIASLRGGGRSAAEVRALAGFPEP